MFDADIRMTEDDLLIATIRGPITAREIFDLVEACKVNCPVRKELWNLAAAQLQMEALDVLRGTLRLKKVEAARTSRWVALVANTEETLTLCRTYAEFVRLERPHTRMRVFESSDEALAWLHQTSPGLEAAQESLRAPVAAHAAPE